MAVEHIRAQKISDFRLEADAPARRPLPYGAVSKETPKLVVIGAIHLAHPPRSSIVYCFALGWSRYRTSRTDSGIGFTYW